MKKGLRFALALLGSAFLLLGVISCSDVNNETNTATGRISGTVTFSNLAESRHGGILVTLDKTDGLRTVAVTQSVSTRSIVSNARSVVGNTVTASDGSYTFSNLEPGTYTVYAASSYSKEKAVCTNIVVRAAETIEAESLQLIATGGITGTITIDGGTTGNTGFLVFVAGTSFMAMTDDAGNYKISDVPAGEDYQVVATKNGVTLNLSTSVTVEANTLASVSDCNFTASELEPSYKGEQGEKGEDGKNGTDGISITWRGSFDSAAEIENPQYLDAYFDKTDGCSYIYDGTKWTLLAQSGANGANGADGTNGTNGKDGENGTDGVSIVWKGELDSAPTNPELNWAYYSTTDGCSHIWTGTKWELLAHAGANGSDSFERMPGGFFNGINIAEGISADDIKAKILALTADTTVKLNGSINNDIREAIAAAMKKTAAYGLRLIFQIRPA